jgi:hypothetical protein
MSRFTGPDKATIVAILIAGPITSLVIWSTIFTLKKLKELYHAYREHQKEQGTPQS